MSVFYSQYSDIILATLSILLLWAGVICFSISREQDAPRPVPAWRYLSAAILLLAVREWIGIFSLSESGFITSYPIASIVQLVAGILVLVTAHKESPKNSKIALLLEGLLMLFLLVLMVLVVTPFFSYTQYLHAGQTLMSDALFFIVKFSLCLVALLALYCGRTAVNPLPRSHLLFFWPPFSCMRW